MISNNRDVAELRKLVKRLDQLCSNNRWPLSLLAGYKENNDVGGCASVHINPQDADIQAMLQTHPKIVKPMIATLYTYQHPDTVREQQEASEKLNNKQG